MHSSLHQFVTALYKGSQSSTEAESPSSLSAFEQPTEPAQASSTQRALEAAVLSAPLVWCAPVARRRGKWQLWVELALILLMLPVLVYGGMILNVRTELALSLVVIVCAVVLFMFLFDTRHPHPRELVVIATLIAIAVAGRSMFFMLPQFKPVAAIVIIAGVSLGQETGFVVGALTALVSNIFFGQGPWTAWQMLAFGLIGFVAGALHYARILPAKRRWLCLYGFLSIFFIYGLIMNPASLLMFSAQITPEALMAIYISGAPMDLIHAISTVVFLAVLAKPFLEKLERLKVKYGLI